MGKALALLEFESVATGVLAVDRMLKKSPVALLRCGTVHPGRYLALVGGTVAATEEAHAEGTALGRETASLLDEVLLPDPHPALQPGLGRYPGYPGGFHFTGYPAGGRCGAQTGACAAEQIAPGR